MRTARVVSQSAHDNSGVGSKIKPIVQVETTQGQRMQLQPNMQSMEPLGGSGGMPQEIFENYMS